ncbi:MAG: YlxR family protein [Clostridia bacterium]|nr:YlxR family protein [Clostridia bacterium]
MKNKPQRMCMGCNSKKDKQDLIRIVMNKDGEITIDKTGKLSGRGAYICDSLECLEKVIKTKRLERTFEIKIDNEIYENLRGVIIESNK